MCARGLYTFAEEGIKLISGVFGKRSQTVNPGQANVLFRFLGGIDAWKGSTATPTLSATFGKFSSLSDETEQQAVLKEWNGDVPAVACPWKQNERAKQAMLETGTRKRTRLLQTIGACVPSVAAVFKMI